jgi:hypothetical protein
MKQVIVLAAFFVVAFSCFAKPDVAVAAPSLKFYSDSVALKTSSVDELFAAIMNAAGIKSGYQLKQANVLNLEASRVHGKKYVTYNPTYISTLTNVTKSDWAAITLLAHEVGHHLIGHTKHRGGSKPALELEADEFAGSILHKLGATLKQAQQVMYFVAKTEASSTHPSRNSRLLAIEKGWNKAAAVTQP